MMKRKDKKSQQQSSSKGLIGLPIAAAVLGGFLVHRHMKKKRDEQY